VVYCLDALTLVLGPERVVASLLARLLADGVYDLTNRVDHKLRLLLMYVMAAVRVRNVPGARHLAHKISPGMTSARSCVFKWTAINPGSARLSACHTILLLWEHPMLLFGSLPHLMLINATH
jgi:hypothetical protein